MSEWVRGAGDGADGHSRWATYPYMGTCPYMADELMATAGGPQSQGTWYRVQLMATAGGPQGTGYMVQGTADGHSRWATEPPPSRLRQDQTDSCLNDPLE